MELINKIIEIIYDKVKYTSTPKLYITKEIEKNIYVYIFLDVFVESSLASFQGDRLSPPDPDLIEYDIKINDLYIYNEITDTFLDLDKNKIQEKLIIYLNNV